MISGKEKHEALRRYALRKMNEPENSLSAIQWVGLLNSYIRKESAESCSEKTGIPPLQVSVRYCDLSIELLKQAVDRVNRAQGTMV